MRYALGHALLLVLLCICILGIIEFVAHTQESLVLVCKEYSCCCCQ